MRVFVTGATGAIGGHAVPALVRAGHEVTALARSGQKAAVLADQGAHPVSVSLFDARALATAFSGMDAVVNLASAMPSTLRFPLYRAWQETERVRTEGSAAVAEAARTAGVGRLVQESVAMLYRPGGSTWIREDWPLDEYPQTRGNLAAEASARRFTAAGGIGTVLRLGLFYGPGAAHAEQLYALARKRIGVRFGPPGNYLSLIHLADAARAVVAALTAPAGPFNVVDDEPLTQRAQLAALATAAGRTPLLRGPGRAGLLLGSRLTSLTRSLRVSNAAFRAETGWAPRYPSARAGWLATAAVLEQRIRQDQPQRGD